jgi:hypothetical protein
MGRSHLTYCPKAMRLRHQLSDKEQIMLGFALMVPNCIDIREQYKLSVNWHFNAVSYYSSRSSRVIEMGTRQIAENENIRHPIVRGKGQVGDWILSTDLLLTIQQAGGDYEFIPVSFKHHEELNSRRKCDLLKIERAYWWQEQADWLLITPKQYSAAVGETVMRVLPWVFHSDRISSEMQQHCASLAKQIHGKPYTTTLHMIEQACAVDFHRTPLVLWQTVWSGLLPIDLSISRFSSDKICILSPQAFWQQNPIVSRRSEWR